VVGIIHVAEEICVSKVRNVLGKPDFFDYKPASGEKRNQKLTADEREKVQVLDLLRVLMWNLQRSAVIL
jgi:hypothetical protein